jgi:hypothetical protein
MFIIPFFFHPFIAIEIYAFHATNRHSSAKFLHELETASDLNIPVSNHGWGFEHNLNKCKTSSYFGK